MKRTKNLIAFFIVISLLAGMLCFAPIMSASAIEFQGATTTVFEQDFGGLSSMPSAFTATGTWTHAGKYSVALGVNSASIMTKNSYDLTGTKGYVFKVGASYSINGFIMYLGWDESAGTGYQLAMYGNRLYLYKNGAFSTTDKENSPYCVATSATYPGSNAYYNLRRYYTVNVTPAGVSVFTDRDANMLSYTIPDGESAPSMKGKFGVKSQYTRDFGVWNMILESVDSAIHVDRWMIDKVFSASDTIEGVNAEGFKFEKTPSFTSNGVVIGSNNALSYDYTALSGDYVVETSVYKQYNANYIIFNQTDASNYYKFRYGVKGSYSLTKYAGGNSYVLAEGADGSSYVSAGNVTDYKLKLTNNDAGDLNIKITLSHSPYTVEVTDYYDDADETIPNGAPITSGKLTLDNDTTGDATYVKSFKAYSVVPESEQNNVITFEKNVFDMSIPKATDTADAMANQGITTSGTWEFADGYAGVTAAGKNIYIKNSDLQTADSYSFKIKSWREFSDHDIRFNVSSDDKSYYQIKTFNGYNSNAGVITFNKVVNGTVADTKNFSYSKPTSFAPNSTTHIHNVTVKKDGTGKLNITAYVTGNNGAVADTITYTDASPLAPGHITLYNSRRLYSVSINTYVSERQENLLTMATPKATDNVSTLANQGITTSSTWTMNDGYASISAAGSWMYINNDKLEMADSYSFSIKSWREYSNHDIRFNRSADGKNYYQIKVYNAYGTSTGVIEFNKVVNGAVADTKNFSYPSQAFAPNNTTHIHNVSVKKDASGKLNITAYVTGNNGVVADAITYTDASPLSPGHIALYNSRRLYSLTIDASIVEKDSNGEVPLYKGRFYNGESALMSMAKGNISFKYPTKLLGDYTVVACLYDDNEIQDIKIFDEYDIYKEKVSLFDTSTVSNDAFIKVYFIDSLGKLNYLDDVYTLN